MINNEYDIDLKKKLDQLLYDSKDYFDIIAPIERKGIRVLELSDYADSLFSKGKVLYYSSIIFHAKELRNKRILLFDESVNTGISLKNNKDKLEAYSREKKLKLKVKTAALLVHDKVEEFPDVYQKDLVCAKNMYNFLSDELSYRILSTGRPLDVDHPIIRIKISSEAIPELLTSLNKIYPTIELGHSGCFGDVRMFTAHHDLFEYPQIDGFPHLLDEGPKKIRLFLKDDILHCVPIAFPGLDISKNVFSKRSSCAFLDPLEGNAFCKILKLENTLDEGNFKLQSSLCYTCVINEFNCRFIGEFLEKLKRVISFEFEGIEDRNLSALHHQEGKILGEIIEKRISNIMNNLILPPPYTNKAKRCHLNKLPPFNRNYLLHNVRPELKNSMCIQQNQNANHSLFDPTQYKFPEKPPEGLAYHQIYEMMEGMDKYLFSEGMDMALDIGYIKPTNTSEGIKVTCEGETVQAIVRLYHTASEDTTTSLEYFLNLITSE